MSFILYTILFLIIWWLAAKLLVRGFVFYKFLKGFSNVAKQMNEQMNATRNNFNNSGSTNNNSQQKNSKNTKSNKMVSCHKCQLYIPEDEVYFTNGKSYCCKEHAQQ